MKHRKLTKESVEDYTGKDKKSRKTIKEREKIEAMKSIQRLKAIKERNIKGFGTKPKAQ